MGNKVDARQFPITAKLNKTDDPIVGASVASGTGVSFYSGFLGAEMTLTDDEALRLSDTSVGTLYRGVYKYVQFKAGSTASNALGQVAFWDSTAGTVAASETVVTPDATDGNQAGITLNAVTKGNYGWIQIEGLATVLYRATITKATPAFKDVVFVTSAANTADVITDATNYTSPIFKRILGIA